MNKSFAVLCLYDRLLSGKPVRINESVQELGISVPTFRRYLSLLRDFCWDKDKSEIRYNSIKQEYTLIKKD